MASLLEMMIGKVFPFLRKVYLKWLGKGLSSSLGGFSIEDGVGLSLLTKILGFSKKNWQF